ncbi:MAG: amidohydrolase [Candidatus Thorarchaeota archaeon]
MNRNRLPGVVFVVVLLLVGSLVYLDSLGLLGSQTNTPPDIIFHNGTILTMEENPAQVEAVAILNESILAIGDENIILAMAGEDTQIIDLDGRTVLPGFIDSHSHHLGDRELVNQTTPEDVIDSVLSAGWTSISELFVNQDRLNELRTLDENNDLRIRVNAYLPISWQFERFGDWYQAYEPKQEFSSNLRIAGVKIFMDGWYTNWNHYFDQVDLEALIQEAHDEGFQIAIHSVTDNGTDIVLDSLEAVLGGESNELYRHRIEHLVLLRDDQIERLSNLGIIASFQLPWFTSEWKLAYSWPVLQNYPDLVGRWRDLLQAGVPSIGSTDFPYLMENERSIMKILSMAVTRVGVSGLTPTDWMLNQTLSVEQTLQLLTIDAAYGTFQEDIKGSIKVGKLADLVVLSDNPLTVPESSLADIEVLMTIVGGIIEYSAPSLQFLFSQEIQSTSFISDKLSLSDYGNPVDLILSALEAKFEI